MYQYRRIHRAAREGDYNQMLNSPGDEKTMMQTILPNLIRTQLVTALLLTAGVSMAQVIPPDPGCTVSQAWTEQKSPLTDATGLSNTTFPDTSATYWERWLSEGPPGLQGNAHVHLAL